MERKTPKGSKRVVGSVGNAKDNERGDRSDSSGPLWACAKLRLAPAPFGSVNLGRSFESEATCSPGLLHGRRYEAT